MVLFRKISTFLIVSLVGKIDFYMTFLASHFTIRDDWHITNLTLQFYYKSGAYQYDNAASPMSTLELVAPPDANNSQGSVRTVIAQVPPKSSPQPSTLVFVAPPDANDSQGSVRTVYSQVPPDANNSPGSVPTVIARLSPDESPNPPSTLIPQVPPDATVPSPGPIVDPVNKGNNIGLVGGVAGGIVLIVVLVIVWVVVRRKRKAKETGFILPLSLDNEFENGRGPRKFSYKEMVNATNNFGEKEKLGVGGFGAVYKGFLKDLNCFVAVKKISKQSKQGSKEYTTEVRIISQLRHKNTVKLIGWCHEKELILVYEFMPNGSLDSHLFKGKTLLTWVVRYKIVQDLVSALLYLHQEGDQCVLHRDIKSSNVMLDSEFNAKLGDFGLARLVDHAKGSQTTALAGTLGYMAPECLTTRKASKESDVYSFGIVALEIACGRRSIEHGVEEDQVSLLAWVWESFGENKLVDVVDKKLCMKFDWNQMERLLIVGLWCAHPDRNIRPTMGKVAQVLNFESPLPVLPPKMPVPNYNAPPTCPQVSSGSSQSLISLTLPK